MNARKEMERTMKTFGDPLIINPKDKNDKINGYGLFQKVENKDTAKEVFDFGIIKQNKFRLWLYDCNKETSIESVRCNKKTYIVSSGCYDKDFGCWRLVVIENYSNQKEANLK